MMFDTVIRNGRIIDGTGNPWFKADIGILGDKIIKIGSIKSGDADNVLDAGGMCWMQVEILLPPAS